MVFNLMRKKTELPSPDEALPGRDMPLNVSGKHFILDTPLVSPWPEGLELPCSVWDVFGGRAQILGRGECVSYSSGLCCWPNA